MKTRSTECCKKQTTEIYFTRQRSNVQDAAEHLTTTLLQTYHWASRKNTFQTSVGIWQSYQPR